MDLSLIPILETLPRYKCHKEVRALKIAKITNTDDGRIMITPADQGYPIFEITSEYYHRHSPWVGGYYVVYKDGYESFSPAAAFEDGYTLVDLKGRTPGRTA